MLAADGCASSSSNPACCFCGVWAPAGRGSGGRHVRALTRLGMLICLFSELRDKVPGQQPVQPRRRNTGKAGNRRWQVDEDMTEARALPKADIWR